MGSGMEDGKLESAPKPAMMFCLNHSSIILLGLDSLDLRTSSTRPVGYETVAQDAGESALKVIHKVKCCQPG